MEPETIKGAGSSSAERGKDEDLRARRDRSREPLEVPDALVADEDVHVHPEHPGLVHDAIPKARMDGEEKRERFMKTYREITSRVRIFAGLPIEHLDRMSLQQQVRDIGAFRRPRSQAG